MPRAVSWLGVVACTAVCAVAAWKLLEELIGAAISAGVNGSPWGDLP